MPTPDERQRFEAAIERVAIDEAIIEAGVFGDTSPVFLRRGQPVLPGARGRGDHGAQAGLNMIRPRPLTDGWHLRAGSPVRPLDDSEPEPDVTIVRGRPRDDLGRTPCPADVALYADQRSRGPGDEVPVILDGREVGRVPVGEVLP